MTRPNPPKSQASDTANDAPPELGTNPRPRSAASSALNLMIAQIILRSATDMFSRKVAKRVRETAPKAGDDDPKKRARIASLLSSNSTCCRRFRTNSRMEAWGRCEAGAEAHPSLLHPSSRNK